jgi:hypothetical protein
MKCFGLFQDTIVRHRKTTIEISQAVGNTGEIKKRL